MSRLYIAVNPHYEDFLYRRLSIMCPVTDDGRDMDICLVCDGDKQEARPVSYAMGKSKDKWADEALGKGEKRLPTR